MRLDRRGVLRLVGIGVAAASAAVAGLWRRREALAEDAEWSLRRATADDAPALASIFNAQLDAGLFPMSDLIEPWTEKKALGFLEVYTGTLLLSRNGSPAGFVGFIDYDAPETESSIAPGIDPEVSVLAVDTEALDHIARVAAVKHLAAAAGRALLAQGFTGCRARIHGQTGFQDLFADAMSVERVQLADGEPEVKEVRYTLATGLDRLDTEGF